MLFVVRKAIIIADLWRGVRQPGEAASFRIPLQHVQALMCIKVPYFVVKIHLNIFKIQKKPLFSLDFAPF